VTRWFLPRRDKITRTAIAEKHQGIYRGMRGKWFCTGSSAAVKRSGYRGDQGDAGISGRGVMGGPGLWVKIILKKGSFDRKEEENMLLSRSRKLLIFGKAGGRRGLNSAGGGDQRFQKKNKTNAGGRTRITSGLLTREKGKAKREGGRRDSKRRVGGLNHRGGGVETLFREHLFTTGGREDPKNTLWAIVRRRNMEMQETLHLENRAAVRYRLLKVQGGGEE